MTHKDQPRPERNAPCPCGSNQKYKKCCGSALAHNTTIAELRAQAEEAIRRRQEAFENARGPSRRREISPLAAVALVSGLAAIASTPRLPR